MKIGAEPPRRTTSSFQHSCRWMVPVRTPKCSQMSSLDRFRASRMRCSIPTKVGSFARHRRCSEPMLSHRQEWRGALGGVRSRVALSGPGRVPLIRSIPCAPRKPSSSTSSGSRRSSASPSTSADTPGRSGIAASSGTTSSMQGERQDVREHFLGPHHVCRHPSIPSTPTGRPLWSMTASSA